MQPNNLLYLNSFAEALKNLKENDNIDFLLTISSYQNEKSTILTIPIQLDSDILVKASEELKIDSEFIGSFIRVIFTEKDISDIELEITDYASELKLPLMLTNSLKSKFKSTIQSLLNEKFMQKYGDDFSFLNALNDENFFKYSETEIQLIQSFNNFTATLEKMNTAFSLAIKKINILQTKIKTVSSVVEFLPGEHPNLENKIYEGTKTAFDSGFKIINKELSELIGQYNSLETIPLDSPQTLKRNAMKQEFFLIKKKIITLILCLFKLARKNNVKIKPIIDASSKYSSSNFLFNESMTSALKIYQYLKF